MRIAAIQNDLIGIRSQLHDQAGSSDGNRKALIAQYQTIGDPEQAHGARTAGWLFQAGIVVFSGSLYALALTDVKILGAITPIGGLAFLAGWAWLAITALR